jgi:DNA protecting protein DprA
MNTDSKKILQILCEESVKPSDFISCYRRNCMDMKKTLEYFSNKFFNTQESMFIHPETGSFKEPDIALNNLLRLLKCSNSDVVNISEEKYPRLLKEIFFPPPVLFYKGDKILENNLCIAIVGTRKSTVYGRDAARYFAAQLASAGITIVSGLAAGIDYHAHKASINEKGSSIGVLGCGIDGVYPYENRDLYNELAERGSIVTEFFPGTSPLKNNFPARNRIISGLCAGVLVIEAPEKSGALITCEFAVNQDREVFAVPGSIFNPESNGNHKLIKNGAKLAAHPDDILEEIWGFYSILKKTENIKTTEAVSPEIKNCRHLSSVQPDLQEKPGLSKKFSDSLNILNKKDEKQKAVYDLIGCKPLSLEEIVIGTGLEIADVLKIISILEFNNLICEKNLNQFIRIC